MNREKMAAMDEQQIRASASRQIRAENAERNRRRLEELEEQTANFIDMDAFDSDDDLPMQPYERPVRLSTIGSDPNMPKNLYKRPKKKKSRKRGIQVPEPSSSSHDYNPPSKRLYRFDQGSYMDYDVPEPQPVPPPRLISFDRQDDLPGTSPNPKEDRDSSYFLTEAEMKRNLRVNDVQSDWIEFVSDCTPECDPRPFPNYKVMVHYDLGCEEEKSKNDEDEELMEIPQADSFCLPPSETVFAIRVHKYPDLDSFIELSHYKLDIRTKTEYETEEKLKSEVEQITPLNMSKADRSKRIYWDVRCLMLRNTLAQNPKNVVAYKKFIQYFEDRIEYDSPDEETANKYRNEIIRLISDMELMKGSLDTEWVVTRLQLLEKVSTPDDVINYYKALTADRMKDNLVIWTRYLDYAQFCVRQDWEKRIKEAFESCLQNATELASDKAYHRRWPEFLQFHHAVYLRYLRWLCDIGRTNDVISLFQMSFEFSFCFPSRYNKFPAEVVWNRFDSYWNWGLLRVGEPDAVGWNEWLKKCNESGPTEQLKACYNKIEEMALKARLKGNYRRIKEGDDMDDDTIVLEKAVLEANLVPYRMALPFGPVMSTEQLKPQNAILYSKLYFDTDEGLTEDAATLLGRLLDLLAIFCLHLPYQDASMLDSSIFRSCNLSCSPSFCVHPSIRSWVRSFLTFIINKFLNFHQAFVLFVINEYQCLIESDKVWTLRRLCATLAEELRSYLTSSARKALFLFIYIHCISDGIIRLSSRNSDQSVDVDYTGLKEEEMTNLKRLLKALSQSIMKDIGQDELIQLKLAAIHEYIKIYIHTNLAPEILYECLQIMKKSTPEQEMNDKQEMIKMTLIGWNEIYTGLKNKPVRQEWDKMLDFLPSSLSLCSSIVLFTIQIYSSIFSSDQSHLIRTHSSFVSEFTQPLDKGCLFSAICHILFPKAKKSAPTRGLLLKYLEEAMTVTNYSYFTRMYYDVWSYSNMPIPIILRTIKVWHNYIGKELLKSELEQRTQITVAYACSRLQLETKIVNKLTRMGVISESEKGSRLAERFAAVAEELNNTFIWRITLHLAAKYEQMASKIFTHATSTSAVWARDLYEERLEQLSVFGTSMKENRVKRIQINSDFAKKFEDVLKSCGNGTELRKIPKKNETKRLDFVNALIVDDDDLIYGTN
ncbi:hypothetical protein WR25_12728 [Diploscapter pachys]|uniref:Uncharacterized protein n=1 Tax=Diploscapter pachys TaxID=2018661 RepID=A0A2A2LLA7_9BILA|nr:hypothetical protein WR25_12728 [Diploscapter pachys]